MVVNDFNGYNIDIHLDYFTAQRNRIPLSRCRESCTKDIELMQFTGLKDKNGKEIYEGDIVKYGTEDEIVIAEIGFKENEDEGEFFSGFYPKVTSLNEYPEEGMPGWDDDYSLEVIGNIYESPDLLK
jgi:uncharacterized phage protein (TIGR01671 family)